jgi:hypothetical protein
MRLGVSVRAEEGVPHVGTRSGATSNTLRVREEGGWRKLGWWIRRGRRCGRAWEELVEGCWGGGDGGDEASVVVGNADGGSRWGQNGHFSI